jgi:hypothetical protein
LKTPAMASTRPVMPVCRSSTTVEMVSIMGDSFQVKHVQPGGDFQLESNVRQVLVKVKN